MRYSLRDIVGVVAFHFKLSQDDIVGQSRKRIFARPRQIAMWLCRQETPSSLPRVGIYFGGRHHTTILHAERTIAKMVLDDAAIAEAVAACRAQLAQMESYGGRTRAMVQRQKLVERIEAAQDSLAEFDGVVE